MGHERMLEILITAIVASLLLLVEHYWPGERLFQRKFHQTANYVLGTLALIVPQSVLFALWGEWLAVAAVWATTVLGGLAVLGAYALDGYLVTRTQAQVSKREAEGLRPGGEYAEGPDQ